jgi:hypothetical protein
MGAYARLKARLLCETFPGQRRADWSIGLVAYTAHRTQKLGIRAVLGEISRYPPDFR